MVAVPSVLPLETSMQIEVHYVWPTQLLIDCAVGSKRLHLRCVGSARQRLRVQRNCDGTTRPLERARAAHAPDETVPQSVPVDLVIFAKSWSE
jgi:hypothetical protein